MHLNSAGCIFWWRDWAATCNISQQEKHFGEAVILRFSTYCLLRFNKKVVSKWLGEKIQGLDKIFTWRKNFLKPKYLQTTTSYKVWHCGQRDQSDTFCVFYWMQKAGKYTEPLKMHYWQNRSLLLDVCSFRFSPQEQPPQVVELDESRSVETFLLLLYPETDRSIFQNIHRHTQHL